MLHFTALLGGLALAAGAAIESRQTAASQVVKLTSIENLAVRANGRS